MEKDINNFAIYLTNNYANYISTVHSFVPIQYNCSLTGEFGGLSKKYARILITINKRNAIENYYRGVRQEINLDKIKKQVAYGFILFKQSGLFNLEQFNKFIDNTLDVYTNPMHRVENLFRKCKFASHRETRIGDEFKPISYSEYILKFEGADEEIINSSYFRYISGWPEENIEYIHSFIALEDFADDGVQRGDILGVKDFDKANKDKIFGNVTRPSTFFEIDWRTI